MNWRRIFKTVGWIVGIAVVFAGGFATAFFNFRESVITADFGEHVLQELRAAQSVGNNILNCRSMVGGNGKLKFGKKAGWWESILPTFKDEGFQSPAADRMNVIVFVHGYNSNLDGAISYGNALCREIQAAPTSAIDGSTPQLVFYTFCWRGDFGAERFGTAEESAETAGLSLARFLSAFESQAEKDHKEVSVFLLSHSLGAKVCLEALNDLWNQDKKKQWVKSLLMFQPAVTVGSICKGKYMEYTVQYETGEAGKMKAYPVQYEWTNEGKYFDCFQAAGNVFATMSSRDSVLSYAFQIHSHHAGDGRYSPDVFQALGASELSLATSPAKGLTFPSNYIGFDFSPSKQIARIVGHGDIVANQPLIDFLWNKLSRVTKD